MGPVKAEFVTQDQCKQRHGTSAWKITWLTLLVLALIAVPSGASIVAWRASTKAETVETRQEDQMRFLEKTLSEIRDDVREVRQMQMQWLRNHKGQP